MEQNHTSPKNEQGYRVEEEKGGCERVVRVEDRNDMMIMCDDNDDVDDPSDDNFHSSSNNDDDYYNKQQHVNNIILHNFTTH